MKYSIEYCINSMVSIISEVTKNNHDNKVSINDAKNALLTSGFKIPPGMTVSDVIAEMKYHNMIDIEDGYIKVIE